MQFTISEIYELKARDVLAFGFIGLDRGIFELEKFSTKSYLNKRRIEFAPNKDDPNIHHRVDTAARHSADKDDNAADHDRFEESYNSETDYCYTQRNDENLLMIYPVARNATDH